MNCTYCGYFNEEQTTLCRRCGADVAQPTCSQCDVPVAWGQTQCAQCEALSEAADKTPCPSCRALNTVSAGYCTACGTPMAVITRVMTLGNARDREPLETWRIYGIETQVGGRDAELDALSENLKKAIQSKGLRTLALSAPTGLGKSRLIAEFQRNLNASFDETVFLQAASRDESGGPFSMFARMLKGRFYIGEHENPASARRKFMEAVRALIDIPEEAERVGHLVGHLIGMHFEDSHHLPSVRDSEGAFNLNKRSYDAFATLLAADAAKNPIVVALDDLQYATRQSGEVLEYLVEKRADNPLKDRPILLIASWNSDEIIATDPLKTLGYDARVELKPLSDQEVRDFVRDALHKAEQVPDILVDRIVDATHGNPLAVEETLRILMSRGVIDTRQSVWQVKPDKLKDIDIPTTVEDTVRARLATLADDERLVLEMAASIGDVFWPELVHCLYRARLDYDDQPLNYWSDADPDARVDAIIESLERKDMIRRHDDTLLAPVDEMHFKHRIERISLFEDLNPLHKRRYHQAIAQWIQNGWIGADPAEDELHICEMVARHYDAAECPDQAADFYLRAARLAGARYANHKAVELFTRGLALLSEARSADKIDAFHDLGSLCDLLGEFDQSLAYFREMLRYSWLLDNLSKGGVAYNKIGRAYRSLGEYDEALEAFELSLILFRDGEDTRGVASTLDDIGQIHRIRGDYEAALKYYSAGLQLRRELGLERSIALSLNHIGTLKLGTGDLKEAMVYFREALEMRKKIGDRRGVAESFNNLAALCVERDMYPQAVTLFEEALEIARAIGYRTLEMMVLNNLGETLLGQGDTAQAEDTLNKAMDVAQVSGDKRVLFDILRNLALVAAKQGERPLAVERMESALMLAEQLGSRALFGTAKHSLAKVYTQFCDADPDAIAKAHAQFQEAADVLEDVGNDAQLARCLSNFGDFLLKQGERERATETLNRARAIFKRLEMNRQHDAVSAQLS
ncbi:tetratricopeptide repeat protein [Bradymonas sediminis]|uniref:Uncharacterized protein n=1 Tax=Bradymonas sediminis TaxID=1548548 RepID=A0A2Z4FKL6_9DELT|nr:tetratricopeptide repeat protein [Bradymonas sediminis]AWV89521.1 hypothetical protein DN745_09275 [Bradymonas sediminis]TDP76751.1 tetratricopeptide repeat protein [Bradymonas sediminis]